MAVIKCKMCGGTLEINNNESVAVCEYCDTKQTLPKLNDEKRVQLYERANHLRRNNEFDKAMSIYEQILNEDNEDAESYWSLVLCRYGIEYVDDPVTKTRIPTVNRTQYSSVFNDADYKSALLYASEEQKRLYEQEADRINEIHKGILEISQKEEPFDVFICYKETDDSGRRTPDSVLATELYHELTREGFKVFFSRITLEDKLGTAYEPYIFAALNSAKVMVVLGTKAEYFNAPWVRNEWSRYLSLVKTGERKMLIPAYRDMDPYDLPEEFSHLQAQDMSKLGFMQDLIRGIKKITQTDEPKPTIIKETVVINNPAASDTSGGAQNKKSIIKFLLPALVVALIAAVLFIVLNNTNQSAVDETAVSLSEIISVTEAVSVTEQETVQPETVIVTVPQVVETQAYYEPVNPDYINGACIITYDTPAHAGVNLRTTPQDDSEKIMVLPEGTAVERMYAPGETSETKYVLVSVYVDGVEYVGYVMQRYVSAPMKTYFDSFVSYNTPDHAGLVLRETSSGNSEKIMVIPEGTQMRVVDNTTGAYWCVEVLYEGRVYNGYVLSTYIESLG